MACIIERISTTLFFKSGIISNNPNISRVFEIRFFSDTSPRLPLRSLWDVVALPVAFSATIEGRNFENINCFSSISGLSEDEKSLKLYSCFHKDLFFKKSRFLEVEGINIIEPRPLAVSLKKEPEPEFEAEWDWDSYDCRKNTRLRMASAEVINAPSSSQIRVVARGMLEMADILVYHGTLASVLEENVLGIEQANSLSFFVSSHQDDYLFRYLSDFTFFIKFSAKFESKNYDDIQCGIEFPFYKEGGFMRLHDCHHSQLDFGDYDFLMKSSKKVVKVISTAFENDGTLLNVIPRRQN